MISDHTSVCERIDMHPRPEVCDLEGDLLKVIGVLQAWNAKAAEAGYSRVEIEVDAQDDYDGPSVEVTLSGWRPETQADRDKVDASKAYELAKKRKRFEELRKELGVWSEEGAAKI